MCSTNSNTYRRRNVAPRLPLDVTGTARSQTDALTATAKSFSEERSLQSDARSEADEMTLLLYAPPRVVVDDDGHILHFFGDLTPFLGHAKGKATFDILEIAHPELLLDLKEALEVARASGTPSSRDALYISDGHESRVAIDVTPLSSPPGSSRSIVAFREMPPIGTLEGARLADSDLVQLYEAREERLRREMTALRAQLRTVAEEQEQFNQALRESNEEVRSSNEELQSINEEMETAREELQSANEELITVNEELRQSNRDLARVNDDLGNLMESIELPLLMLDQKLRVRRFTPQAARVADIGPTDEGRHLRQLRFRVNASGIEAAVRKVLDDAETYEQEVADESGHWFQMHIRPYRSAGNEAEGAVLTFIDVDELKTSLERIEARVRLSEALNEIDSVVASSLDFTTIMQSALDDGVQALGVDAGTIEIREGGAWIIQFQNGFSPEDVGVRLDDSQAAIAVRTEAARQPQAVTDCAADPELAAGWLESKATKSVLAVPLIIKGTVAGCMLFHHQKAQHVFSTAEIEFARRLASTVSLAVENARLFEAEHHAAQLSASLNKINEILMSALSPEDVVSRLVSEVSMVAGADKALVVEVIGEMFTITHVRNVREDLLGKPKTAEYFPGFALAASLRKPVLIEDNWNDPITNKEFVIPHDLRAFQLIPLIIDDEVVGVLAFAYDAPQTFDAEDHAFAGHMATAMSLALKNARLFEAQQRAKEALIRSRADLDRAQEISHLGSWRHDFLTDTLHWSDETYRIFGIPIGAEVTYEDFLARIHPDDREPTDGQWQATLEGEHYDTEFRIVVDGTVKWIRERGELERDGSGTPVGGYGSVQDITERKAYEHAQQTRTRQIQVANKLLALFVGENSEGVYDEALDIIMAELESEAGVLGYIDEDGDLICPTMSRLFDSCEINEVDTCIVYRRHEWRGLWGRALQEKQTLYSNDEAVVPVGHVPVC